MNPAFRPFVWTFAAIALSAATAYWVAKGASQSHGHAHRHDTAPAAGKEGGSFHDWLHEQLAITSEQEKELEPIEKAYAEERSNLQHDIDESGRELADALAASPLDREAIDRSLAEIHRQQGELQGLTIGHFLEMKEHLSPEQAAKLLRWTRESITHEHRP